MGCRPIRVLMIMQGNDGERERADRLWERFRVRASEQGLKITTLQDEMQSHGLEITFQHFMDMVEDEREQSRLNWLVAFWTEENRDGTKTGNLWSELGYWVSRRGDDRVVVYRRIESGSGTERPNPASNDHEITSCLKPDRDRRINIRDKLLREVADANEALEDFLQRATR